MEEKIIGYLTQELIDSDVIISPKDDLFSNGLVDSMGLMRLVTFIEDTYGIDIPPEDLTIENFSSVETMVQYLSRELNEG